MHESVMSWVAGFANDRADSLWDLDVLEVGSYNVNGSVRPLFDAKTYVGVDVAAGPGVDRVADACDLPFDDKAFDLVVSTEMLEHCERPWLAVAEMHRVLVPGGVLLLTCRGFDQARGAFPFHNPPDHYRYSEGAMLALCDDFTTVTVAIDPQVPGWFVTAIKRAIPIAGGGPETASPGQLPT